MIVVDASVIANVVADDGPDGDAARTALRGEELAAPDLVDVEVLAVLRKRRLSGDLGEARLAAAVDDLLDPPIERQPMTGLLQRAHELRSNVTPYDAVHVALAEALDCVLVTADRRLASAPGIRADVQIVQTGSS